MVTHMSLTLKMWSIIGIVSNVNLTKDHNCSDSDVLTYAFVKYYSFGALSYVCTPIQSYVHMKALFNTSWSIP